MPGGVFERVDFCVLLIPILSLGSALCSAVRNSYHAGIIMAKSLVSLAKCVARIGSNNVQTVAVPASSNAVQSRNCEYHYQYLKFRSNL